MIEQILIREHLIHAPRFQKPPRPSVIEINKSILGYGIFLLIASDIKEYRPWQRLKPVRRASAGSARIAYRRRGGRRPRRHAQRRRQQVSLASSLGTAARGRYTGSITRFEEPPKMMDKTYDR